MKEEIKANRTGEFEKQRRDNIIKNDKYVRIEITVSEEDRENPCINFQINNATPITIAYLYKAMQGLEKFCKTKYPLEVEYAEDNLLCEDEEKCCEGF